MLLVEFVGWTHPMRSVKISVLHSSSALRWSREQSVSISLVAAGKLFRPVTIV